MSTSKVVMFRGALYKAVDPPLRVEGAPMKKNLYRDPPFLDSNAKPAELPDEATLEDLRTLWMKVQADLQLAQETLKDKLWAAQGLLALFREVKEIPFESMLTDNVDQLWGLLRQAVDLGLIDKEVLGHTRPITEFERSVER